MGRPAKNYTKEEQQAKKRSYVLTEHAKQLRSEQNRRAYAKRTAHLSRIECQPLPRLPTMLKQHALEDITGRSFAFMEGYRADRDPSPRFFVPWTTAPPYHNSAGAIPSYGLERHAQVLRGTRWRIQREAESVRLHQYKLAPEAEFIATIREQVISGISNWNDLNKTMKAIGLKDGFRSIDYKMGMELLYWKARSVTMLVEDWKAAKKGRDNHGLIMLYDKRYSI